MSTLVDALQSMQTWSDWLLREKRGRLCIDKVSAADVAATEQRLQLSLPPSYRDFVLAFGLSRVEYFNEVTNELNESDMFWPIDALEFAVPENNGPYQPELFAHLRKVLVFKDHPQPETVAGFWTPGRDDQSGEMPVVILSQVHGSFRAHLEPPTLSFFDFVIRTCQHAIDD